MLRFRSPNKWLLWMTLAAGLTAPLAYWMLAPWQPSHWLARRLQAEMNGADGDRVDFYARQLAALEFEGWSALLAAEQAPRPEVRIASRRAIAERIESWRHLAADMATPRVRQLAKLLAESKTSDADSLHFRADLAESLLAWPTDGRPGMDLVYHCEQLVRAAKKVGWPKPLRFETAPEPPLIAAAVADATPPSPQPADSAVTEMTTTTDPDELIAANESIHGNLAAENSFAAGVTAPPFGLNPELLFVPSARRAAELAGAPGEQPAETGASPRPIDQPPIDQPPIDQPPDWPRLAVNELIRHLRNADLAPAAEDELHRRGFNELNLRVARAAADADLDHRLKLVRMLPELTGLDAIGWLLVLARDESPRIRTAAVQILSTANNPRVQRELEQLDQTETDDGVRNALRNARSNSR